MRKIFLKASQREGLLEGKKLHDNDYGSIQLNGKFFMGAAISAAVYVGFLLGFWEWTILMDYDDGGVGV